ncbi:MAG: DNA polymerase III subunit gamma/tau [Clostridia bacterium]|nr:DNA polymerase III subunit gamma/tau [Clostridia bacterium]
MYQALYRKWRPETFDDVYGQDHITSVLKYEAINGTFSHAYLFCGSRGTGKTTCAKILSRVINCLDPKDGNPCGKCAACRAIESGTTTDVLEMDAASNNGVEDIRDIRDEVVYAPSDLKYRVYIIDEVHMLSVSAFNALLKTLEEPPAHVVFILATTELHKLPATIISRCQRFDFRRISTEVLASRLSYIAEQEGLVLDADAARLISRQAQGGMRDAISLLELCAGSRMPITPQFVDDTIGSMGRESMIKVAGAVAERDFDALFDVIDKTVRSSKDIAIFWQELISLYRDMLVVKTTKNAASYLDLTDSETQMLEACAANFTRETLVYHCKLLDEALITMQKANAVKRIVAEMTLVRMCDPVLDTSTQALLSRIARLEEAIASGAVAPPTPKPNKEAKAVNIEKTSEPAVTSKSKQTAATDDKSKADVEPASDKTRTLRPIRAWNEVVSRIAEGHPVPASFFKTAKAFTADDGKIVIKFDGDFQRMMAERDGGLDAIRGALSYCLQKQITQADIVIETQSVTQAEDTLLDLILDAADEA